MLKAETVLTLIGRGGRAPFHAGGRALPAGETQVPSTVRLVGSLDLLSAKVQERVIVEDSATALGQ